MPGKFNFTVFGGLEKEHYKRFRELRTKYDLTDRGMIECMIEYTVESTRNEVWLSGSTYNGQSFQDIVDTYKVTAPVDAAPMRDIV